MNEIIQDGIRIRQTSESIWVNGVEYPLPEKVKSKDNQMSVINGEITINGYKFNPKTTEFTKIYQNRLKMRFWTRLFK